ncbi:Uu.00g131230.m01.CDS01 [Anthostomella pinea]|uniref:Uu.00g131230.m01.CDS01 n=1 Tax=Anthostomella pinea TaxID=933095 RepID=A0AAI8YI86_9PEZI|nr:Uu.00g131230.m01.CDS01 [Anthostomella pinea]
MDLAALANTPALAPPAGQMPDFNATGLQNATIAVTSISIALAFLFLIWRLYTTVFIVKGFYLDDGLIILAFGCSLLLCTTVLMALDNGFGKHLWDVRVTQIQGYLDVLSTLALSFLVKLAMLTLYHRINPSKPFRICLYIVAAAMISYQIIFMVIFIGPCRTSLATPKAAKCFSDGALANAILNVISDAAVIVLPIPMLHRLHMPLKQKLAVGGILGLGSAAAIISIARVALIARFSNPDITWVQAQGGILSILEGNLAIICNCAARLKPFFDRHSPRMSAFLGSKSGTYKKGSGGSKGTGKKTEGSQSIGVTREYDVQYQQGNQV